MEHAQKSKSAVWWEGATSGALRGIPQGLLLGLGGALLLWGLAAAFPVLGLAEVFQGFLFVGETAAAGINPIGFVALNTVLTAVGNFLTGGDIAVNKYQQEIDHARNEQRIHAIEGRERQVEQVVSQHLVHEHHPAPRHVQKILEGGPRVKVEKSSDNHAADVVTDRLESAERTIH
jgi:hypothetical protein